MLRQLNKYRNSEFFLNTFKLSSSTTIAQIIAIACAPFLYRIYEREDYGLLGLYMATTGVISVFSTFQYLNTIMIAKNESDVFHAISLNRLTNAGVSTAILFIAVLLYIFSPNLFNIGDLGWYFLLIPVSIYLNGQNEIYRVFANQQKAYDVIMVNTILIAVISPALSIPLGLIYTGPIGLFVSLLFGQVLAYLFLQQRLKKLYKKIVTEITFKSILNFAKLHSSFPKFMLPTEFVGMLARNLPVFMIKKFYGLEWLGVYNLAMRMLGLPSQLITKAIGEVFRQKVTVQINNNNEALDLFKKTLIMLCYIVTIPLITIMLFGPLLFNYFFGEKWILAGDLSRVLIWLFSFQMVASPLSFLFVLRNKMKETLICHIYILISSFIIFYTMVDVLKFDILHTLSVYVVNYCIVYFYYIVRSYRLSNSYEG